MHAWLEDVHVSHFFLILWIGGVLHIKEEIIKMPFVWLVNMFDENFSTLVRLIGYSSIFSDLMNLYRSCCCVNETCFICIDQKTFSVFFFVTHQSFTLP